MIRVVSDLWSVIAWQAGVAVVALGVVLAVDADAASRVIASVQSRTVL